MPIQFDNYDEKKIDRLKNHLTVMASKGQAKYYEIFVDNLKAIPKTDEPGEFEGYEDYLTADSDQVRIVIYDGTASPRNTQYVFMLKARTRDEALNLGLNGTETLSRTSLTAMRERNGNNQQLLLQIEKLENENEELRKDLQDNEKYADSLAAALEVAKQNANKIGGVHWGEVMSVALEGIVKRNITKIPALSSLAGIGEIEGEKKQEKEESDVTFKKKAPNKADGISEQEKVFLEFLRDLQNHFTESELSEIMGLLDVFAQDKQKLKTVLELVSEPAK